jgi:nitrogen regulatory protein PII
MKAVMIVFNQAHTEKIEYMLDFLNIGGYTMFSEVKGRGTETGNPRLGNHTWPEMNSAVMTVIEDEKVEPLLKKVKKIDEINKEVGIRAFVWTIEGGY